MAWTEERVALLTEYWEKGHTASQIAELLGEGLSRNAVIGKAHRLGLPARPSPLKSRKAAAKPRKAKKAPETAAATPEAPATPMGKADPVEKAGKKDAPAEKAPKAAPAQKEARERPAREDSGENSGAALRKTLKEPAEPAVAESPKAAPEVTGAPVARPATRPAKKRRNSKVTLLDLNDRICRWPIGHPDEADFHFCGKPVNPGFPYCPEHCLEAYQAQLPHRERQGGAPRGQQHGHTGGSHTGGNHAGNAANPQAGPETPS